MSADVRDQMARAICESTSAGRLFPWDTLTERERAPWRRMADAAITAQREACTITTAEQLDALPLDSVVVDAAGIPRTARHGDSHTGGGWTHAGRSPLKSRELADGRPMVVVWTGRWRNR